MGVAEQVELASLEEQVVWVHPTRAYLVAGHRVVVEGDRLVAKDRRLDLGQTHRQLMTVGFGGDRQSDRLLLRRSQRAGASPCDLLQGKAQRLGVGELAVQPGAGRLTGG